MTKTNSLESTKTFSRYVAIATAITTLITFTTAFLTPPLSGPFCEGRCFDYPYTDITSRYPRDYFWMFPAILDMILYVVLIACVHNYSSREKKIFSQTGLSLAIAAAVILISNYFVQVSVIQPSLLKGEKEGIAILTQYNPHGVFIALEEIGFVLITISLCSLVPVFPASGGLNKALRITLVSGFLLAIIAFAMISRSYGIMREYIFEVAIISIAFFELVITSVMLERIFRTS